MVAENKNSQPFVPQRCPRVNCPACAGFAPNDAPPVSHVLAMIAAGRRVCTCCTELTKKPELDLVGAVPCYPFSN